MNGDERIDTRTFDQKVAEQLAAIVERITYLENRVQYHAELIKKLQNKVARKHGTD